MKIYLITNRTKQTKAHLVIIRWLEKHKHDIKFKLLDETNKKIKIDNFDIIILEIDKNSKIVYKIIFDALMQDKPVLLLYKHHTRKPKDLIFPLEKRMLKYLAIRGYTISILKRVLEKFFINLEKGPLERFNFFISKDIEDYLNWIPYSRAQTRSDFLRALIQDKMKKDKKYGKYKKRAQI